MPHDKNGNELKVGDKVLVPCQVVYIGVGEEACNATVEAVLPGLGTSYLPLVTLNTRQVVKAEEVTK